MQLILSGLQALYKQFTYLTKYSASQTMHNLGKKQQDDVKS